MGSGVSLVSRLTHKLSPFTRKPLVVPSLPQKDQLSTDGQQVVVKESQNIKQKVVPGSCSSQVGQADAVKEELVQNRKQEDSSPSQLEAEEGESNIAGGKQLVVKEQVQSTEPEQFIFDSARKEKPTQQKEMEAEDSTAIATVKSTQESSHDTISKSYNQFNLGVNFSTSSKPELKKQVSFSESVTVHEKEEGDEEGQKDDNEQEETVFEQDSGTVPDPAEMPKLSILKISDEYVPLSVEISKPIGSDLGTKKSPQHSPSDASLLVMNGNMLQEHIPGSPIPHDEDDYRDILGDEALPLENNETIPETNSTPSTISGDDDDDEDEEELDDDDDDEEEEEREEEEEVEKYTNIRAHFKRQYTEESFDEEFFSKRQPRKEENSDQSQGWFGPCGDTKFTFRHDKYETSVIPYWDLEGLLQPSKRRKQRTEILIKRPSRPRSAKPRRPTSARPANNHRQMYQRTTISVPGPKTNARPQTARMNFL